ncbi:Granule-bound starch synthase 1 chloroplastic/amyloplastic [Zea mays]|uniref:Granule-bound starch synthase 1 chloroplastic/amyloplastic n=1 Tax=Zea mays TaxID=4577 RepID=A0A1D6NW10_MAIZE|nr:Granule-bound starch synthase 1, chloroplastic/amyloplastic [Zea mays]ONM08996.1 Granule-bound starch synthase 1 chloroplastic/amyloplastic [Zea mays]
MNVVFVGAEMAPWSKTGGLGDVLGGPCQELGERAAQPRGRRRRARGRRRGDRAARQGERGRALKSSACRPPDLARGANMLGHLLIYAVSFM